MTMMTTTMMMMMMIWKTCKEDLGEIIEDYLEDIDPCILVKGKFVSNQTTKRNPCG